MKARELLFCVARNTKYYMFSLNGCWIWNDFLFYEHVESACCSCRVTGNNLCACKIVG